MKRRKILFAVLLFLGAIVFGFQSCGTVIDINQYPIPSFAENSFQQSDSVKFSISLIETGYAKTPEAFVYKGGHLFKIRRISHVAVLVQHPKGTFLIDTGLGDNIESQFYENFSFMERKMYAYTKLESVKTTLLKKNFSPEAIDFIIPTHLHWDHASGIEDFPKAGVWTTKEEYNHAISLEAEAPAFVKGQYDAHFIEWFFFDFEPTPYEIFSESYDVFGDGTIVLVKLFGHTKGSIGIFVNLSSGKRYFFTGDLTWAVEGFTRPSEKHPIPRKKVDGNRERVRETIVKVHHLMKAKPEIIIVPAHDFNAQKGIAHFPTVEQ